MALKKDTQMIATETAEHNPKPVTARGVAHSIHSETQFTQSYAVEHSLRSSTQSHTGHVPCPESDFSNYEEWFVQLMIQATIPHDDADNINRHWKARLFDFMRGLKTRPVWLNSRASDLEPLADAWREAAIECCGEELGIYEEEIWVEALDAWDRVKEPGLPIWVIGRMALREPAPAIVRELGYNDDDVMGRAISVCQTMQREVGDQPFFLSVSNAMEILSIKHRPHVSRIFKRLQRQGVLRLVQQGTRQSGMASEYLYLPEIE